MSLPRSSCSSEDPAPPRSRPTRRAALALLGGVAAAAPGAARPGTEAARLIGWIAVEPEGRRVQFVAMASAERPVDVTFDLRITRAGAAGRSVSRQGGRVSLPGGDAARALSRVAVSLEGGASFAVGLTVTAADGKAVEAAISHPPTFAL